MAIRLMEDELGRTIDPRVHPTGSMFRGIIQIYQRQEGFLEALALARQVTDWAADAKAEDIVLLDVRRSTYISDYFVICTATSERHLTSLSDRLRERAHEEGIEPTHIEGTPDSGWLLIDYGDVILHIFSAALRDFYHLEKVWSDASVVVRVL